MGCDLKNKCSYYQEFGERDNPYWKSIAAVYCNGTAFGSCQRYFYQQAAPRSPARPERDST